MIALQRWLHVNIAVLSLSHWMLCFSNVCPTSSGLGYNIGSMIENAGRQCFQPVQQKGSVVLSSVLRYHKMQHGFVLLQA